MCHGISSGEDWDRLLPQCELTLNLLRLARVNTKLSSWSHLNDNYNFNKTFITPHSTEVIVDRKPKKRARWA